MDRLRALEIFIAVANTNSLSAAGRKLSISAPSVTRVLGDFERSLGVILFHRTTRAVTLTESGQQFLEDAKRIVNEYQSATDAVKGAYREPSGLLRVTAPTLFGQYYVLPLLTQFMDQYPNVRVEAVFLDRVVNIIEEGFDIAVRIGELPDSNLIAAKVGSVRKVVCGHPEYFRTHGKPKLPKDLADHKLISATSLERMNEWRFRRGITVKVKPALSLNSLPAVIEAATSGWGLTQVVSYQIGPAQLAGKLETVLEEFEPDSIPIHLVHAEGRSASAKVRSFIDLAKQSLKANQQLIEQTATR